MHSAWDGEHFREALQSVMTEAGLERQDVAALAGINRSQVSRWLSGANRPRFDALARLAEAVRQSHPGLDALVTEMTQAAGYDSSDHAPPVPTDDGLEAALRGEEFKDFTPAELETARRYILFQRAEAEREERAQREASEQRGA